METQNEKVVEVWAEAPKERETYCGPGTFDATHLIDALTVSAAKNNVLTPSKFPHLVTTLRCISSKEKGLAFATAAAIESANEAKVIVSMTEFKQFFIGNV